MKKIFVVAAFALAITGAFATKNKTKPLVDNRRDASCETTISDCQATGPNDCAVSIYALNDLECQVRLEKRP